MCRQAGKSLRKDRQAGRSGKKQERQAQAAQRGRSKSGTTDRQAGRQEYVKAGRQEL